MSKKMIINLDIIDERRRACSRHLLLRTAQALQRFDQSNALLDYATRLIRVLMGVGGAAVILQDAATREFYFQTASYADPAVERNLKGLRIPLDQGPAGQVHRTGKPLVMNEAARNRSGLQVADIDPADIFNLLAVPLRIRGRVIGVLQAVNKRRSLFDHRDVELLGAVAGILALRIETEPESAARRKAREQAGQRHLPKARIIHYLSHELKTPLAVLSACMRLLERGLACPDDPKWRPIHERIERNLLRLLDVEYKLEDIMRAEDEVCLDAAAPPAVEGHKSEQTSK